MLLKVKFCFFSAIFILLLTAKGYVFLSAKQTEGKNFDDTTKIKYALAAANRLIHTPNASKENLQKAAALLKSALIVNQKVQSIALQYRIFMRYADFYDKTGLRQAQARSYENAISASRKLNDKRLEAQAWYDYFKQIPDTVADYRNKSFYNRALTAHRLYKEIAVSKEDHYREAKLLKDMADFHLEEEKFDLAIKELLEVIEKDKRYNLVDLPMAYDLLSAVYQRKGELSKALECALKSVEIAEQKHEEVLATYLNRVGAAYEAMNKPKESIEWYKRSYEMTDKSDPYIAIPAYTMATQMIKLGEAKPALVLLKQTWATIGNKKSELKYFMYLGFAESYTALGDYKQAGSYFSRLLSDSDQSNLSNPFTTSVYFAVSEYYFAQKKYTLALAHAEKAGLNQITMALPRQIRLNELLYKINLAFGRQNEAINRLQAYHKLKDSMLSQDNLNRINRLQVEFKASQKENENEILRKQSQIQKQELKRTQLMQDVTIGSLILITMVLILVYGRFRLKKKLHDTLVKKKAEIDLAYRELESNVEQKNRLIFEKEGLLQEVHHRVKNSLQLTISLLNSQSYYLENQAAIDAIKDSQHRLKSIALIHQKLYQNQNVATINIQPYIFELVEYLNESLGSDKKINFELDILNIEMDISKAIPMGLIINEAITNIFKYAFTNRPKGKIEIRLSQRPERMYSLFIKDDGIGLPPDFDYTQSNTLGIVLMKGLSAQIDASFSISEDNGVCVHLIFENNMLNQPLHN